MSFSAVNHPEFEVPLSCWREFFALMSRPDQTPLSLPLCRELSAQGDAAHYAEGQAARHASCGFHPDSGGTVFIYPFGALVSTTWGHQARETELARLHHIRPNLTTPR